MEGLFVHGQSANGVLPGEVEDQPRQVSIKRMSKGESRQLAHTPLIGHARMINRATLQDPWSDCRVSQRAMLQALITDRQTTLLETMDSGQQDAFYDAA